MALDFTVLVEEHGDFLCRFAMRHFSDRSIAEELVQDTFLAALEAAGRFQGHASPRTWLTSILRHKIIDRIRRKVREQPGGLEATGSIEEFFEKGGHWSTPATPQPWHVSPEALPVQKQFFAVLRACLAKVPEAHRQAFLLREVHELEVEEICNVIAISPTNLRVMLHRSRLALRRCLGENWFHKERS